MTAPGTKNPTLPTLSSIRFIAAIAVFSAHAAFEMLIANEALHGLHLFTAVPLALIGVSFFFILSGFILTWTHRPNDTARTFWRRRFFRIYPSTMVVLAATIVLMYLFGQKIEFLPALAQMFMVHAWIPDESYFNNFNGPTWSLSVEFFCYSLFPLLLPLTRRIRPERLWYWVIGIVGVVVTAPFLAYALLPDQPRHALGEFSLLQVFMYMANPDEPLAQVPGASIMQFWFVYEFPPMRLLEFLLGVLLARIILSGRWIRLRPRGATLIFFGFLLVAFFTPYLWQLTAVAIIPALLLVGAVATADASGRRNRLQARWLVRTGDLTLAFYLLHAGVLIYGHLLFGYTVTDEGLEGRSWSTPYALLFMVGAFVVTMLLSWLLHRYVEVSAMARWSTGRAPRPLQPADAKPEPAPLPAN